MVSEANQKEIAANAPALSVADLGEQDLDAWICRHRGPARWKASRSSSTHGGWSHNRCIPRAAGAPAAVALAFAASILANTATYTTRAHPAARGRHRRS